ncbi:metallophosphoesterase [Cognatishimia sp.]|uniref:metallophosphoesterase n=1 Tax=Cognatishimia sp. TaxID=2211648 RepID=UPI0035146DD3
MSKIFAVGDIHGHFDQMERALDLIWSDGGHEAQIVFVGDYIDRGPDSRLVLDFLIEAKKNDRPWTMLLGNHDDYLRLFLEDGNVFGSLSRANVPWFDPILGGAETMESYGVETSGRLHEDILKDARKAVPQEHLDFISLLPRYHATPEHIFVHAGIRPGVPLQDQDPVDLIWIRQEFLDDPRDHGKLIVHGHTAVDFPENAGNRVNLDGGTGFGRPLYPGVFEDGRVWILTETGRQELEVKKR